MIPTCNIDHSSLHLSEQMLRKYLPSNCIMFEDNQNNTRKEHNSLNVTNLRTQQLSDSYSTESSAPCIEVAAICDLSNIFCNSFNFQPNRMQSYS
jgi:hypothetical protein